MTNAQFEYMTSLQYKNQALQRRVDRYESDPGYVRLKQEKEQMRASYERTIAGKDRKIRSLESEVVRTRREHRRIWFEETLPQVEAEHAKELKEERAKRIAAEKEVEKLKRQLEASREKSHRHAVEKYKARTRVAELEDENKELRRRLNQNHLNSSRPTSAEAPWEKAQLKADESTTASANDKVSSSSKPEKSHKRNSRTANKADKPKKPRIGHKPSFIRRHEPTETVQLRPDEEVTGSADWARRPDLDKVRQVNDVDIRRKTTDYVAQAYQNRRTGEIVYGKFPPEARRPVNYGNTLRALIAYMSYYLNVSENRIQTFLRETTNGQINVSAGFISKVGLEFSKKTEADRAAIFRGLHASPWAAVDTTSVILNGQQQAISICANDRYAYYSYTESKGHAAARALPIYELDGVPFSGTTLSDCEKTFKNYGTAWQVCLAHILRELMESMQNESERHWGKEMHELMQSMIHECKAVLDAMPEEVRAQVSMEKGILSDEQIDQFVATYSHILEMGAEEYDYDPPTWYTKGRSLLRRLDERAEDVLYFLHHGAMPYTNNLCERLLRIWVRKRRQAIVFRSPEHIHACCHFLSFLETRRLRGRNIFIDICDAFSGTLTALDA